MRPTFRTRALYIAECYCGWRCETRNAMGLAAQHFPRCGKRIHLERTVTYVWDPEREAAKRAPQKRKS